MALFVSRKKNLARLQHENVRYVRSRMVRFSGVSHASVVNRRGSRSAGWRSRERHSPEWRITNRQSGDWRALISTPSYQINFEISEVNTENAEKSHRELNGLTRRWRLADC
jgi:hypothetical protein